ncbi:MAG: hypothetical protein ABI859_16780 [Pseudomonadota bacterium]
MRTSPGFDDIVIGSGLAALGTVSGLDPGRRVLVLGGPAVGKMGYYDERRTVPCLYQGKGGLGNFWHGVIPTAFQHGFGPAEHPVFAALFSHFYPRSKVEDKLGRPWLFVPWRPIRPARELREIAATRNGRMTLLPDSAVRFTFRDTKVEVHTSAGSFNAGRLWIAAGVLQTPGLLTRSMGIELARGLVSDHAFCYIGQVDGLPAPRILHTLDGVFMPVHHGSSTTAIYTVRPARSSFRKLDFGIEQRALFGLPTGSALSKIARRLSTGLLAEALYNRFGVFASARRYSIYAQVETPDAYALRDDPDQPLSVRASVIRQRCDQARSEQPFPDLVGSQRPDVHIPGIHLHHSVDLESLAAAGINQPASPVQVVDASVMAGIGPEHHSFKMMVSARARAAASVT